MPHAEIYIHSSSASSSGDTEVCYRRRSRSSSSSSYYGRSSCTHGGVARHRRRSTERAGWRPDEAASGLFQQPAAAVATQAVAVDGVVLSVGRRRYTKVRRRSLRCASCTVVDIDLMHGRPADVVLSTDSLSTDSRRAHERMLNISWLSPVRAPATQIFVVSVLNYWPRCRKMPFRLDVGLKLSMFVRRLIHRSSFTVPIMYVVIHSDWICIPDSLMRFLWNFANSVTS